MLVIWDAITPIMTSLQWMMVMMMMIDDDDNGHNYWDYGMSMMTMMLLKVLKRTIQINWALLNGI